MSIDFFFFNDTATTEIYTLSLHDALPILPVCRRAMLRVPFVRVGVEGRLAGSVAEREGGGNKKRSEEHTSELQSQSNLVCRLLLDKKQTHNVNRCGRSRHLASMLSLTRKR